MGPQGVKSAKPTRPPGGPVTTTPASSALVRKASPGTSNTRALTPPGPPELTGNVRLLQARVDALRLAYVGDVHHERLIELSSLKHNAPQHGAWLELADSPFEVCATGGSGLEFRLRNTDVTLLVGQGQFGVGVIAEPRAMFLATVGPVDACIVTEQLAGEFLGFPVPGVRVRRLDLCADVMGVSLPLRTWNASSVEPARSRTTLCTAFETRAVLCALASRWARVER